jgi:hypothetical protein
MTRDDLARTLRYRVLNPGRYHAGRVLGMGRRPAVRVLIATDGRAYTSEQQLAPFRTYAAQLRRAGVFTNHQRISDVLRSPASILRRYDVVLAKLTFRTPDAEAERVIRTLSEARGRAKLVYCDGDDDPCVEWPAVLPWVDLYLKKHAFADPAMYGADLLGKSNLTDYVIRHHGISIAGDPHQHAGVVPAEQRDKIFVGWNIGLDDKIQALWREGKGAPEVERTYDVVCRASVRDDWTKPLRGPVTGILSGLSDRCKVLLPTERVNPQQYYQELRSGLMCVSPFGYGETCWRDFESVLCRTLLIKPDMGHLRTVPDIFRPFETYVPCKWDFSDLEAVCLRWRDDAEGRRRIVEQAYRTFDDFLSNARFVERVTAMLARLGVPTRAAV